MGFRPHRPEQVRKVAVSERVLTRGCRGRCRGTLQGIRARDSAAAVSGTGFVSQTVRAQNCCVVGTAAVDCGVRTCRRHHSHCRHRRTDHRHRNRRHRRHRHRPTAAPAAAAMTAPAGVQHRVEQIPPSTAPVSPRSAAWPPHRRPSRRHPAGQGLRPRGPATPPAGPRPGRRRVGARHATRRWPGDVAPRPTGCGPGS